jgi:hypothetical protein
MRQVLARQDMGVVGGTPERFAGMVRADVARWARVVSAANIKAA